MRHAALVLALLTACTLPAQLVVRAGQPRLHPDRVNIRAGTIALLVTPKDSVEQRQATLMRSVVRLHAAAGDIFRETQEYDFASGPPGIDTLDVDAGTSPDSGVRTVDYSASEPFVVSMMYEAFTAAYPIADDTALDVVVADPPSARVSHSRWEIRGHQTLITTRGPIDCLIATVSGRAHTMWFDQRDGSLLWLRWMIPGGTEVWKLPARDFEFRGGNAIAPLRAP